MQRVIWRGKQPIPSHSDWPGEIAVYRLDNEYWDCYYEYQLLPALLQDNSMPDRRSGSQPLPAYCSGSRTPCIIFKRHQPAHQQGAIHT
ncbi:MAG: hypothetical protein ACRYGH_09655 [Janthinobacterium lividum]